MKQRVFNIYCEVYNTNLLVILGMDKAKVQSYMEKKYKLEWPYQDELTGGGQFNFDKWPYHMIWINRQCMTKHDFIPKLSHEVLHLVLRVAKAKQVPTYPEIDNLIMDEPIAYLMEYYMRQILKKCGKI